MRMPFDAMEDLPDDALLARFAGGDAVAARLLTLRLTPRVMAHAYRLLGNRTEAEDVTQEALLRLWRQAPDWRPGEAKVST
ncbi:MAG: RNA polymerase subunit sigma, partial [Roseovarius sp.]|nr:RNA polymerase subunit sigma [Roseovarius sp.]